MIASSQLWAQALTNLCMALMFRAFSHWEKSRRGTFIDGRGFEAKTMKVTNSLKSAKIRDKDCRVVRRKGRVYVINKKNPRLKVRQG